MSEEVLSSYEPPLGSPIDNFAFMFMFAKPVKVFGFKAVGVVVKENWEGTAEIWVKTENKSTVLITQFPLGAVVVSRERELR